MARADQPEPLALRLAAAAIIGLALASVAAWAQEEDAPAPTAAAKPARQATGYSPLTGWQINLGVTVAATLSDNGGQTGTGGTGGNQPGGLSGQIMPTLSINGDTPRVQVNFVYQPSYTFYVNDSSQNYFGQNLNARAHALVWEDIVYVDAYAYASQVPQLGGRVFGAPVTNPDGTPIPGSTAGFARQNLVQVYAFSIAPTAVYQFTGWGTATATASYQYSQSSGAQFTQPVNRFQQAGVGGRSEVLQETVQFATGENLGRWQDTIYGSLAQVGGDGVSRGGSLMFVRNTVSYALTRWVSVMGSLGYQALDYPNALVVKQGQRIPTLGYKLNSLYWNGSAKFIPNADSHITVGYGRSLGSNQFNMDAHYAVTARTTLTAQYYTTVGTGLFQLQQDLTGGAVGAPVVPTGSINGFVPGTQNIYRTNTLTAAANTTWDRDSVSLGFSASEQRGVATAIVQTVPSTFQGGNSRSIALIGSWSHQFSEVMNGLAYASVGRQTGANNVGGGGGGTDYFINGSAGVTYLFSPTLSGSARYSFYDQISQTGNGSYISNQITVSLTKQF